MQYKVFTTDAEKQADKFEPGDERYHYETREWVAYFGPSGLIGSINGFSPEAPYRRQHAAPGDWISAIPAFFPYRKLLALTKVGDVKVVGTGCVAFQQEYSRGEYTHFLEIAQPPETAEARQHREDIAAFTKFLTSTTDHSTNHAFVEGMRYARSKK